MVAVRIHQISLLTHQEVQVAVSGVELYVLVLQLEELKLHFIHLAVVVVWHAEPRVTEHPLRRGPLGRAPLDDGRDEVSESRRLFLLEQVPVHKDPLQTHALQVVNAPEVELAVLRVLHEVVVEHVALLSKAPGHGSEHFHEESQVVVVLLVLTARPRVKQEIASNQLKHHASEAP